MEGAQTPLTVTTPSLRPADPAQARRDAAQIIGAAEAEAAQRRIEGRAEAKGVRQRAEADAAATLAEARDTMARAHQIQADATERIDALARDAERLHTTIRTVFAEMTRFAETLPTRAEHVTAAASRVALEPPDASTPASETDPGHTPPRSPAGPLRDIALKGGSYLALREALGMLIRLGGVVIITRKVGPHNYGIYVAASAFVMLVASVAQLGAEVLLIRQSDEPTLEDYYETFSVLVVVSIVVTGAALALSWPAALVVHNEAEITVFRVLLIGVPINILWAPAQARIERRFEYRRMAWLELGGDVALYGAAVPLAFLGFGVYSLVIGYIAWQSTLLLGSLVLARLRPRWRWSGPRARLMVRHGLTYSSNNWIDQLSALANPLIVGAFAGATGVGLVGLAIRLVDTAGFALRATWRLGLAAVSRIVGEPDRLRPALEEGMMAQALALGVPLAGLALLSPWLIPFVFGRSWAHAAGVYGVLGLSRLLGSISLLQMTVLFAQGRNTKVAATLVVRSVLIGGACLVLVPFVGIIGFGVASLVANLAWVMLDRQVRPGIGFSYRRCSVVVLALGVPMLAPLVTWPWGLIFGAPILLMILVGDLRQSIISYTRSAIAALTGRTAG